MKSYTGHMLPYGLSGRELGSTVVFCLVNAVGWVPITGAVVIPLLEMFFITPTIFAPRFYALMFFRILIVAVAFFFSAISGLDLVASNRKGMNKQINHGVSQTEVLRLSIWQRIQHVWLISVVGTTALTGFARIDPLWGLFLVNLLGGRISVLNIHIAAGFGLGILAIFHAIYYGLPLVSKLIHHQKIELEILPSKKDLSDLVQNIKYYLGMTDNGPQFGRFSYIQKFDYWAVYWGILVLGVPGILMWLYGRTVVGGMAYIFHTEEALLAVTYLFLVHSYNAHVDPLKFPVDKTFITGKISVEMLQEEHPLELPSTKR